MEVHNGWYTFSVENVYLNNNLKYVCDAQVLVASRLERLTCFHALVQPGLSELLN